MSDSWLRSKGPALIRAGFDIVPIKSGGKFPTLDQWQKVRAETCDLTAWLDNGYATGGVGVQTRQTPAIDLDISDVTVVAEMLDWCAERFGAAPMRTGRAPRQLLVFQTDAPFRKRSSTKYRDPVTDEHHQIEVLGDGQQFVAFAVHPGTGEPYRWGTKELGATEHFMLPVLNETDVDDLFSHFESVVPASWEVYRKKKNASSQEYVAPELRALVHAKAPLQLSRKQIGKALKATEARADEYEDWIACGMALYHQFDGDHDGLACWNRWSQASDKYDDHMQELKWSGFAVDLQHSRPITFATVLAWQKEATRHQIRPLDFPLLHVSDLLSRLGPVNWLIDGVLEANTTGLFYGDPGTYKSFLVLDQALHIAIGRDWHGHAVQQGPVIYIAGEGHGGLARRVAAWQTEHGIDLSGEDIYFSERAASLYDEESALQVVEAVGEIASRTDRPAVVIIDTLARNFGGGDENSNTDMGVFLDHVDRLIRHAYSATVIVVHHTGQAAKDRARGASALRAGVDFEYRTELTGPLKVKVICTKMKDAEPPEDLFFEGRSVLVGTPTEAHELTSLVFHKCAAHVVELPGPDSLKGKQRELYDLIDEQGPIERRALYDIAEGMFMFEDYKKFGSALVPLVNKNFVQNIDGSLSTLADMGFEDLSR
jgi:hypothetical protein